MFNLLLSRANHTKWCAPLQLSTQKTYTNFSINKDEIDDVSERKNPIKIVSYRFIVPDCGLVVLS